MTVTPAPTMTPPDERTEPDMSGRRIGDYQLLRRLGRGGMAEVYLAEQLSLRRQVALKVLRKTSRETTPISGGFSTRRQAAAKLVPCQHRADL